MKKLFTFALVLLFAVSMSAQNFMAVPMSKAQERAYVENHVFPVIKSHRSFSAKALYLAEDFDAGIPTDWTITDGGSDGNTWEGVNDHNGNTLDGTPFAIVNSDAAGSVDMDEILESPAVDVSGETSLFLSFDQYYNSYSGNEVTDVDVWDGSQWQNVYTAGSSDVGAWGNPDHQDIDVSAYVNAAFKVRFHYYNANYDWYWAIDNVLLYHPTPNDLTVTAVAPESMLDGDTVTPMVTVKNFGTATQQDFTVGAMIINSTGDTVYNSSLSVTSANLASFDDSVFVMTDDFSGDAGQYTFVGYVVLSGDEDVTNDTLTGNLVAISTNTLTGNTTSGDYAFIDLGTATEYAVGAISTSPFPMAEEYDGTNIYRIYSDMTFGTVDLSGNFTSLGTLSGVSGTPTGLAWDWNDSIMYVMVLDGSNAPHLCTLDISTLQLTDVASNSSGMIIGIEWIDGAIYGPAIDDDNLYKIDLSDGSFTVLGPVGIDLNYGQDVAYDYDSLRLYSVTAGSAYSLGYYDLTTGAFTQVAAAGGQHATFVSLTSPPPTYSVTFNVTDTNGTALENAQVVVGTDTLMTDASGVATMSMINGNYTAYTSLTGYYNDTTDFTVADTALTVDVELVPLPTYDQVFYVTDTSDNALVDAMVVVGTDTVNTDSTGYATYNNLAGTYQAIVSKAGYYNDTVDFTLPATTDTITVALVPMQVTYTITFNVDMSAPIAAGDFIVGTDSVLVTGSYIGWAEPGTDSVLAQQKMFDVDSDSIYTLSVVVPDTGHYEYKYFKNAGWDGGEWDGGDNRTLDIVGDTVVNDIWGSLTAIKALNNVEVTIAPNPVQNVVRISADANYNIAVYNVAGKVVATERMTNNVAEIDLSNLQSGVYMIKVYNDNVSGTYKLIKK